MTPGNLLAENLMMKFLPVRACFARLPVFVFLCAALWGAMSMTARAEETRLAADDVVSVTVLRHPELSSESITIPASGKINLPTAGQIVMAGKTPSQAARAIAKALSSEIRSPEVTVSLREQRVQQMFVLGTGVARPGVYPIKPGWRISEVVAAAGGVPGRADETSALLARVGAKSIPISVVDVASNASSPQNVRVRAGDVLTVTALEPKRVTVSGDVLKPDIYELRRAPRLIDAVVAAGGLKQRPQDTSVTLLRNAQRIALDYQKAEESKLSAANTVLLPGDTLIIANLPLLKVTVDGFVRTPNTYDLDRDATVIEAVARAGGLTVPSEQVVATIKRGIQTLPIDLARAAYDPKADVSLRDGDVVLLSEPKVVRVQVTGQVTKPGPLRVPIENATVAEAIARAGGLGIRPEIARISVLRTGADGRQLPLEIDAVALISRNDLSQNVRLQDNDLISISEVRPSLVYISGQVAKPGPYEIMEGDGVPELIARAGGYNERAALTRVTLQRGTASQTVDVYDALKVGGDKPNVPLREGDFVVVPESKALISVIQNVQRPGEYAIPERDTLTVSEALSLAGGPRDRAAVSKVTVLRKTPDGTRSREISYDLIAKGNLSENINLQPGDIVYVPASKRGRNILGPLGTVLGLGRIVGIF
jgi:polysaccharide export outer membrane protein